MRFLSFLLIVAAFAACARAAEPGEELTISVLTIEPGDLVFEKFGHNAILVHDAFAPAGYSDIVYHWGLFDFDQERFFLKYALGQMDYSMGGFPLGEQLNYYRGQNRRIWQQELNLTPAQRLKLRDFLRWNEQPENATYRYNYFTDNCSTRVRDAIDAVVGGAIEAQLSPKETDTSFRWHTRRLTRDNLFWYSVLHTVLGPATDRKITAFEETFLPLKLRDHIRAVTNTEASGAVVPLVRSEREIVPSTRAPEPQAPPNWVVPFFLAGVAVAGMFCGLSFWAERKRGGKIAFCVATSLYAALLGACGVVGLWFWFFSDHWAAWRNENLLGYKPLALPLVFLLPLLFRSRRARRAALVLAVIIAISTVLGTVLSPLLPQVNAEPLALVLPINLALAGCVWRHHRSARRAPVPASA